TENIPGLLPRKPLHIWLIPRCPWVGQASTCQSGRAIGLFFSGFPFPSTTNLLVALNPYLSTSANPSHATEEGPDPILCRVLQDHHANIFLFSADSKGNSPVDVRKSFRSPANVELWKD